MAPSCSIILFPIYLFPIYLTIYVPPHHPTHLFVYLIIALTMVLPPRPIPVPVPIPIPVLIPDFLLKKTVHFMLSTGGVSQLSQLTEDQTLACVLAAAMHDVGHPALNNDYLRKVRTADEYETPSVLSTMVPFSSL